MRTFLSVIGALLLWSCSDNPTGPSSIDTPSLIVARAISPTQIEVSWQDNSDNEDGFKVERRKGEEQILEEVEIVGRNVTRLRQTMLDTNRAYFFRVQGFNSETESNFTNIVRSTTLKNNGPWRELESNSESTLRGVDLLQANLAVVVGDEGSILRTDNGGQQWNTPFSQTSNELKRVDFFDAQLGVVAGGSFPSGQSLVLLSENAGFTWLPRNLTGSVELNDIAFVSEDTIVAVGNQGLILRSVDGGLNWMSRPAPNTRNFNGVHFPVSGFGVLCGSSGVILESRDRGQSWQEMESPTTARLGDVDFHNTTFGMAVGAGGIILRTLNGTTWEMLSSGITDDLNAVDVVSTDDASAVGFEGTIIRTTKGGESWFRQDSRTLNTLFDISFVDDNIAMAVGAYGTILLTDIAGGQDL